MIKNNYASYGSVAKFFHWLIALLVVCMIIYGITLNFVADDFKPVGYNIHKLTGLTIFSLMILRGLWAIINPKPLLPIDMPWWQQFGARFVQYALYAVVLSMPIVGMIGSSAGGRLPHIGNMKIGYQMVENKALAEQMFFIHNCLAYTLIVLIVLHVSAAFYHHYWRKDNVLLSMLPTG